jgi:hypothetical protein
LSVIIEPHDEIQVWISGTGRCLWGRIQPTDGVTLKLTVQPLPDTVAWARAAGVRFEDAIPVMGTKAHVPQRLVDVIFGDSQHLAAD